MDHCCTVTPSTWQCVQCCPHSIGRSSFAVMPTGCHASCQGVWIYWLATLDCPVTPWTRSSWAEFDCMWGFHCGTCNSIILRPFQESRNDDHHARLEWNSASNWIQWKRFLALHDVVISCRMTAWNDNSTCMTQHTYEGHQVFLPACFLLGPFGYACLEALNFVLG